MKNLEVTLRRKKQILWISNSSHGVLTQLSVAYQMQIWPSWPPRVQHANQTITCCQTLRTLAHSQFSNLSAQQCKTLLFTNTHFSPRSVCWLSNLYVTDLDSPLSPWVRPHKPQLNSTAAVGFLVNSVPGKLIQNWTFTEVAVRKNINNQLSY